MFTVAVDTESCTQWIVSGLVYISHGNLYCAILHRENNDKILACGNEAKVAK